jgi:dUTPase
MLKKDITYEVLPSDYTSGQNYIGKKVTIERYDRINSLYIVKFENNNLDSLHKTELKPI